MNFQSNYLFPIGNRARRLIIKKKTIYLEIILSAKNDKKAVVLNARISEHKKLNWDECPFQLARCIFVQLTQEKCPK